MTEHLLKVYYTLLLKYAIGLRVCFWLKCFIVHSPADIYISTKSKIHSFHSNLKCSLLDLELLLTFSWNAPRVQLYCLANDGSFWWLVHTCKLIYGPWWKTKWQSCNVICPLSAISGALMQRAELWSVLLVFTVPEPCGRLLRVSVEPGRGSVTY